MKFAIMLQNLIRYSRSSLMMAYVFATQYTNYLNVLTCSTYCYCCKVIYNFHHCIETIQNVAVNCYHRYEYINSYHGYLVQKPCSALCSQPTLRSYLQALWHTVRALWWKQETLVSDTNQTYHQVSPQTHLRQGSLRHLLHYHSNHQQLNYRNKIK